MRKISKSFTFDSAHRLVNYKGNCGHLHGHTYTAIINFAAKELDEQGFVIDYDEIKKHIKSWVDCFWDHGFLVNSTDPLYYATKGYRNGRGEFMKIYVFDNQNPTAERIAEELFKVSQLEINTHNRNCKLISVGIKETPSSYAEYSE